MAFWTDKALEPKRAYRWLAVIGNMPAGATYYVKSVKKPSLTVKTTSHNYLNHKFNFPANVEWETVSMTLVDPVNPDASQNLAAILENSGYVIPGNANHLTTISKKSMVDSLGKVQIIQLNSAQPGEATGVDSELKIANEIEVWTLNNPIITKIDFGGELSYESDKLTEITLEFAYDWADLVTQTPHSLSPQTAKLLTNLQQSTSARFKARRQ